MKLSYDYVIIGSGFGGSIAAFRLATAQRAAGRPVSVCVLERGKRYNMGEFPRDILRTKDWYWRHQGKGGWTGFIDFRTGENISVLCGSGVGGTSLLYLDVQINAFASTFDYVDANGSRRWPQSVDWHKEMPGYYERIVAKLHPSPIPDPPLKTLALKEAAAGASFPERFHLVDLAIFWGKNGSERGILYDDPYQQGGPPQTACQYCGECFVGCNTHSKNTLDLNYLWLAESAGAEVYSRHRVSRIEPIPGGGYRIFFDDLRWNLPGTVEAKALVISAGCMGSTELLLRSKFGYRKRKRQVAPTLPRLSDMLGHHFSGNGDFGAVAFKTERVTDLMVGPTITAAIDCREELNGRGFLIEDGGFPDILRANFRKMPGGIPEGRWLVGLWQRLVGSSGGTLAQQIFELFDLEMVRDALPYLAMGIDAADGEMTLDEDGQMNIRWKHPQSLRYFRKVEETLRAITETPRPGTRGPGIDGNLMLNPTWSADKELITVHPLGGCPMGDDASSGVVSPAGEVFNYPNLYVVDGSIVPSAVGPNPSKTIGALAERISDHIIRKDMR